MSRRSSRKPWLHKASGFWCTSDHGKRIYLDRDYELACRKLLTVERETREPGVSVDWLERPIVAFANNYLDYIQANRKPGTYEGYRFRLLRALRILGPETRVGAIDFARLKELERSMQGKYSLATIWDTIAMVQSAFAWAYKENLIPKDPLKGFPKPEEGRRLKRRDFSLSVDELKMIRDRIGSQVPGNA